MKTRFAALAVAVAATMGLASVPAFAQNYRHDGGGQGGWQHQRAEQGRADWGHGNRYAAPRYYGPSYSYGYHRNNNGDVAGALVLGALTGALIGQAANTYYAPPATYYTPPATYYPQAPAYYNPGYGYYGN